LCIAYSGRCLLSGYFNRRDANQGTCTNACRWEYKQTAALETDSGDVVPAATAQLGPDFDFAAEQQQAESAFAACGGSPRHPAADRVYLLEEAGRPGQLMPIMEDEHGTYIMNSKDLRAVEHVARLVKIGVDSLKIEGRTKSQYYVTRTAQIYRRAIDDAVAGRPFNPELIAQLDSLANRGYTSGFLERRPAQDYQNYETGSSQVRHSQYVGEVLQVADGWAEVETKNRFAVGDTIEVIHPSGNRLIQLDRMKNADGEPVDVAAGHPVRVWIPVHGQEEATRGALLARLL
jgi:putative protease